MITVGRAGARRNRRSDCSIWAGVMLMVPVRRCSTARSVSSFIASTETEYPITLSAITLLWRSKITPRGAGSGSSRSRLLFDWSSYVAWLST